MPRLREFLYVDVDRTRSLLAQLQGGVVDEVKSQRVHSGEGGVSARVLGFGGHGQYGYEAGTEESRSLQDMTFAVFEELAEDEHLIEDLGAEISDSAAWNQGEIHARLRPGQVVRITCDLQILDGGLFRERMERFASMAEAMLKITPPQTTPSMTKREREAAIKQARDAVMGDLSSEQLKGISSFVESFVGDSVALRVLPCGAEHLELGFSGALLGRKEYLQEEREHLFSRYGTRPSGWTAVLQIAAIPTPAQLKEEYAPGDAVMASGGISRGQVEQMASGLLTEMERIGLMDGPRWPSISATPLGIYRDIGDQS